MFHYHYIIFNTLDGSRAKSYPDGYYTICMKDLIGKDGIDVVSTPLDNAPQLIRYIYAIHNSDRLNRRVSLPLKNLWYPYYFRATSNKTPYCFIISESKTPVEYLYWLKRKYPDCKIVLIHRDLRKISLKLNERLSGNPILDLEMTYDKGESEKYGYPWFSEFESKIDIPLAPDYPESDVFFAGKVKDRLPILLEAYRLFSEAGLKVSYYLTGIPKTERIPLLGVKYAERNMSYREMLYHTYNTRCVLEINQANSDGYTSRFLEAVMYGKPLITNNLNILKSHFYKSGHIQVIKNIQDIDVNFVNRFNNGFVDYNYNGEFSPLRMLERVDEELINKYGIPD